MDVLHALGVSSLLGIVSLIAGVCLAWQRVASRSEALEEKFTAYLKENQEFRQEQTKITHEIELAVTTLAALLEGADRRLGLLEGRETH